MAERERSIEDIRQDIAEEEENFSQTVEQICERSKEKPDWRSYVKDYPYWALGVAAGLGYFASRLFQARTTSVKQIAGPIAGEDRESHGDLHAKTTGPGLIKVTLLGIAVKAAADWIKNAASTAGQAVVEPNLDRRQEMIRPLTREQIHKNFKNKRKSIKKVLMVLTSHNELGSTGKKTGFWLEEFAAPYYVFKDSGAEITLASPKGGQPPLDPKSDEKDSQTAATERFKADREAQTALSHTVKLSEISPADYDALFYPGGHGPLWDLAEDKNSIALIEAMYAQGKAVSAVCHAPGVFRHARSPKGMPLLQGKYVTGFSNSEERAVGLTDVVPFLVEDELQNNGGNYSKGADWQSYFVRDGNLITGQNPASSEAAAKAVLETLIAS